MSADRSTESPATVLDDPSPELTRNYAEALLNAAIARDQVEVVLEELSELVSEVLDTNASIRSFLLSPTRSGSQIEALLVRAFEGKLNPLVFNFLRVLGRNGRLILLDPILREVRALWDKKQNRVQVRVISAVPLDDAQQSELRNRLADLTQATPVLNLTLDPTLIGGLVVQVGDHLYDASVRQRLEQLRNRLIEGKRHEIQSRRDHFRHST